MPKTHLSFQDYIDKVGRYMMKRPAQRVGQCHMIVLADVAPELAYFIAETCDCDPFYVDEKMPRFLRHLESIWGLTKGELVSLRIGD